ncbi:hypothetical protein MOQ_000214 [Trypanosoma cruzi marinkellei]|uniref:Uncharacterized protein n=1 Tax=Trypanosoma cruzi marinkellei TaxID=85056 RepID=K2NJI2_TRYCR|nr:hypothetical protein MOQ_000214 [Trypanosoma cruzi marinkellei]
MDACVTPVTSMRREHVANEGRGDITAPTATAYVRVVHKDHPPSSLHLSEAERQEAVTVPLVSTGGDGDESRGVLTVMCVVEAARQLLRLDEAALQLSLHGVVLSPQQDLAEVLEILPCETRKRLVFLLSPTPADALDRQEGKRSRKSKQVMFAESPSPTSKRVEVAAMMDGDVAQSSPMHGSPNLERGMQSTKSQCVFLESWLQPNRCARCQCVRAQHSVFTPTRQERLQSAMVLANKTVSRTRRCQSTERDREFRESGLPYYYADPHQWEPQRGERYHGRSESCHDFCASWGSPMLCRNCQRVKEAHEVEVKPAVTQVSTTTVRRPRSMESSLVHSGGNSPPAYARKTCPHLTPSSSSEYCTVCYTQRVKQISQVGPRSPLVDVTPRRLHASPARLKANNVADWLALPAAGKEVSNMQKKDSFSSDDKRRIRAKQRNGAESWKEMALMHANNVHAFSSSFLSTTVAKKKKSILTIPLTRINYGAFQKGIPWDLVLPYVTFDDLLVCRAVSSAMCRAAVSLVYENCHYIIDVFDIPLWKRELLVQHANRYASVILEALHEKRPCFEPTDAVTHPLRFLHFCILQFLGALRALGPERENGLIEKSTREGKNRALTECLDYFPSVLPAADALAVVRRGDMVGEVCTAQRRLHGEEARVALRSLIEKLAWCNFNAISPMETQGITDAFEAISVAAAASLVYICDDTQLDGVKSNTKQTRFMSLGKFFEEHALMPLVNFLLLVEVVTKMKWRSRKFLDVLRHHHHQQQQQQNYHSPQLYHSTV